jgi:pimeloyl-ACP methyl ester carboxylesterase
MLKQISFVAPDDVLLFGLLYTSIPRNSSVAIYIHGAGSSSILNHPQLNVALASSFAKKSVDTMFYDNRGAGYLKKLRYHSKSADGDTMSLGGMAYETLADSTQDILAALHWAADEGYQDVYLIGHSTGANKLCYFMANPIDSNAVRKVFLLAGGDDITLQRGRLKDNGISEGDLTRAGASGQAEDLVPASLFPGKHPISYKSLLELITPGSDYDMFPFGRFQPKSSDPSMFHHFKSVKVPVIAIYGSLDFGTVITPSAALKILTSLNDHATGYIIEGADHNFSGHEATLARIMTKEL